MEKAQGMIQGLETLETGLKNVLIKTTTGDELYIACDAHETGTAKVINFTEKHAIAEIYTNYPVEVRYKKDKKLGGYRLITINNI